MTFQTAENPTKSPSLSALSYLDNESFAKSRPCKNRRSLIKTNFLRRGGTNPLWASSFFVIFDFPSPTRKSNPIWKYQIMSPLPVPFRSRGKTIFRPRGKICFQNRLQTCSLSESSRPEIYSFFIYANFVMVYCSL